MRIIGFGAHPDDVEIFFFGLLATYRAAGHDIGLVIATDGAAGGEGDEEALRRTRRAEALAGAAVLGVTPVFLDAPDGALSEDRAAPARIAALIEETAPDLVVTHAPNDYHPDHRALSHLVSDAARFRVPVLFADTLLGVDAAPTIYVDISAHFAAKCEAIEEHASQRPQRFVEAVTGWNRFRALQCGYDGCAYAEAFSFSPRFPFSDIRGLLPPAPPLRPLGRPLSG